MLVYKEERRDLFRMDKSYALVHCISSDFALGAGIAAAFRNKGVRNELMEKYPATEFPDGSRWHGHGYCLKTEDCTAGSYSAVYNLVTKEKYFHKPTYDTLREALLDLRDNFLAQVEAENKAKDEREDNRHPTRLKLAMPYIGCGLDKLEWYEVSKMVQEIFEDMDMDITVCYIDRLKSYDPNKNTARKNIPERD